MQGLLSGVWGVASIVGPVTGGYITTLFSWRWVFYLNIPFGVATAVAVAASLRDRPAGQRHAVDYAGAALLMMSVTLLILALSRSGLDAGGGQVVWLWPAYLGAVVCGVALARVERRAAEPMVPVDLLADRMVAAIAGTGLLVGVGMFGAITYVPLFVQEGLGGSAVEAGRAPPGEGALDWSLALSFLRCSASSRLCSARSRCAAVIGCGAAAAGATTAVGVGCGSSW